MAVEILKNAVPNLDRAVSAVGDRQAGWVLVHPFKGFVQWRGYGPRIQVPLRVWCEELLDILNKQIWLDGTWAVFVNTWNPAQRIYGRVDLGYLDKDNDLQFTVTIEEPFSVMLFSMFDYVEQAYEAYNLWRQQLEIVGVTDEEKIKAALGQKSKDKRPSPGFDLLALD